jgi:TonB family protein
MTPHYHFRICVLLAVGFCISGCPPRVAPATVARCATALPLPPGVSPPKVVYQKLPKTRRIAGTELFACLELTINTDGSVSDIVIVEPGDSKFDAAVVEAAKEWRYLPARRNGQPVSIRRRLVIYNYRPPTF